MDLLCPLEEHLLGLSPCGIGNTALDGTSLRTLLGGMEADALDAEIRIDDEDVVPKADRTVGTLVFAGSAGDAVLGNQVPL